MDREVILLNRKLARRLTKWRQKGEFMSAFTLYIRNAFDGYKSLYYSKKPSEDELNDLNLWGLQSHIGLLDRGLKIYYWDEYFGMYIYLMSVDSLSFIQSVNNKILMMQEAKKTYGLL